MVPGPPSGLAVGPADFFAREWECVLMGGRGGGMVSRGALSCPLYRVGVALVGAGERGSSCAWMDPAFETLRSNGCGVARFPERCPFSCGKVAWGGFWFIYGFFSLGG